MSAKSLRWTIVALIAGSPAALALGLGDIHLHSALNAPLDADIDLIGATADDLSTLKAQLAPRDQFSRNGLDYPAFLSSLSFSAVHTPDGRDLIKVRSAQPVTEPFVTLLVELDWARGRVAHEYTVLLDPPVYSPGAAQAPQVAAPVSGAGNRAGSIQREPAAAAPAPATAVSTPVVSAGSTRSATGGDYTVRRGDSLSRIAGQYAGGAANRERWMVAAYQANKSAFDGNMNTLRSGAVLRLPDQAQVAAVSAGEASSEVHRQFAAWRSGEAGSAQPATAASAGADAGRLHLVSPGSPQAPAASAAAGQAAGNAANAGEVQQLQKQLAESQRMVQVQQAELAQLQAQLAARNGGKAAPSAANAPSPAPAPAPQPAAQNQPQAPAPATPEASAPAPEASAPAAESAPAEAAESQASQPVRRKPHNVVPVVQPEGSPLDLVKQYWWALAALVAVVAAWVGLRKWRERQQNRFDDSLGHLATMPAARALGDRDEAPSRADSMVVEESGEHERPAFDAEGRPAATPHVAVDSGTGPEGLGTDQGGPLAEADFHMAYGLYDQAADLVRAAIQREPDRRDLKLKLLEVFFVWGNKEQFLEAAHALAQTREQAPPGEWDKILIMGKQLVPEDPLFASGSASGAADGGVDLDLGVPTTAGLHFDGIDTGVDLDIGTALAGDDEHATTSQTAVGATDKNLALHLPDEHDPDHADTGSTLTGATRLMSPQHAPGVADDQFDLDGYTIEHPQAGHGGDIRDKLDSALKQTPQVEETAELALDDLGLDLGGLGGDEPPEHVSTGTDAPTLVAGLDDHSRELLATAEQPAPGFENDPAHAATGEWKFDATDMQTRLAPIPDIGATSSLAGLNPEDVDFDLGAEDAEHETAVTGHQDKAVDLDVGTATVPEVQMGETQRLSVEDLALPDLEPVTMSEVGTKLDLARAYMDMGDPEGARNILEEVVKEGSQSQQQEAQRLIESLPG